VIVFFICEFCRRRNPGNRGPKISSFVSPLEQEELDSVPNCLGLSHHQACDLFRLARKCEARATETSLDVSDSDKDRSYPSQRASSAGKELKPTFVESARKERRGWL
jgi:hypothetical protein